MSGMRPITVMKILAAASKKQTSQDWVVGLDTRRSRPKWSAYHALQQRGLTAGAGVDEALFLSAL
jgi:hypothetical protein